jgi:hypothetical protein
MKLKLLLIMESDSGETEVVQEVTKLERHSLRPENLGLTLSEAKELLQEVQRVMITHQSTGYVTQQIPCPKCGKIRSRKGKHQILFRTLFGKLRLDSPRFYHCGCCSKEQRRSFSPLAELLTERTAPGLAYLENKFAALISYGLTAELLAEVLPTGGNINVAGVCRNLQGVAERMEAELGEEKWQFIDGCQRDWDRLPPPGPPLTVGFDGGFIHAKDQKSRGEGWFEVIAGKSMPEEGAAKSRAPKSRGPVSGTIERPPRRTTPRINRLKGTTGDLLRPAIFQPPTFWRSPKKLKPAASCSAKNSSRDKGLPLGLPKFQRVWRPIFGLAAEVIVHHCKSPSAQSTALFSTWIA